MKPYYQDEFVTLYHADCTRHPDLWADADVLITDPPYGIPGGRVSFHQGKTQPTHDDAAWDDLALRDMALEIFGDRPRAVFGSPKFQRRAPEHRGAPLIWDKGDRPGMGDYRHPFGVNYELIWINGDGWTGQRRGSVFRYSHHHTDVQRAGHPTPKPVALMEQIISYAPPGIIADPFAGGGATLIAAKHLQRHAIGVEIDKKYCEIIARRCAQGALEFDD